MKRVLISSFYNRKAVGPVIMELSKHAEVFMANGLGRSFTEEEIIRHLPGIDAVIAAEEPYTARVFDSAPMLRIIARDGVGFNNIDITEATKHGVMVTNAPVLHESVADLTFGLIIATVRKIAKGDRGMRAGCWTDRDAFLSSDVNGRTLGLIGFGRIAKAVARRAAGFDMKVIANDVFLDQKSADDLGVKMVPLDILLSEADIISMHTPLTDQTYRLINAGSIAKMKQGVYIINASRGEVVDEDALMDALRTGKIAGAGLDVVCDEPPGKDNPLFKFDNVVFTPHVGSDTFDVFLRVYQSAVRDILAVFSQKKPHNLLNPEVLKHKNYININTEEKN
jgi:D-3-phosphoglycerate dehydrogenase